MKRPWTTEGIPQPIIEAPEEGVWVHRVEDFLDPVAVRACEAEIEAHREGFERSAVAVPSTVKAPRLCLAFGDGATAFSDLEASRPWPTQLGRVKSRLSVLAGHPFNYALANWYRDGHDFTGWHADKIAFHERDSTVAIISLGASRELHFRRKDEDGVVAVADMSSGSLLLMSYGTHLWFEHSIPVSQTRQRRVSITYRYLIDDRVTA